MRLAILCILLAPLVAFAQPQPTRLMTSGEILLGIQKARTVGSVLYMAAHPDDENTALIAYMANVRKLRTGYLSLTRGDGGQNLIGTEIGTELGAIRTQELLAARATDGGEQFFTRARDFGYSKTVAETYRFWNRDSVLADVVWILRTFRPDVIITRFTPDEDYIDTHGHHTASAQLAIAGAIAAADPTQFPEQLQQPGVTVWQVKRIFWNGFRGFGDPKKAEPRFLDLEIGQYIPLLGKDAGELAAESRSMHKSQGFGSTRARGSRVELLAPLWGDTTGVQEPFEGINTTWERIAGAEAVSRALATAESSYRPDQPKGSIVPLVEAYKALENIKDDYWRTQKQRELARLIRHSAGLWLEAYTDKPGYSAGDSVKVTLDALERYQVEVRILQQKIMGLDGRLLASNPGTSENGTAINLKLQPLRTVFKLDAISTYSTPFWLRQPGTEGRFSLPGQAWVGRPHPQPGFMLAVTYRIDGLILTEELPIIYKSRSATDGDVYQPVTLTPPVAINPLSESLIFNGSTPQKLSLRIKALQPNVRGKWLLELPEGWSYQVKEEAISIPNLGGEQLLEATITPGSASGTAQAVVQIGEARYSLSITQIAYTHIPTQTIFRPATVRLVRTELACTAQRIGYVPGAGDKVAESLQAAGLDVTILDDAMLTSGDLSQFSAILVGIRAYNALPRMLTTWSPRLLAYAEAGGTLVVQYNTTSGFQGGSPAGWPFPFALSRDRVTDENAAVTFLQPGHAALTTPNRLTESDFLGWVQERGLYHSNKWPETYTPLLSMADPGEQPSTGSLIIGHTGKGAIIYTGLSFFRELPAGVPGAYRLLANLLSYRQPAK